MITVLYVDDETRLLEITKIFLERTGEFSVDTVESAPKALGILKTTHYDAVVSDYQMPGMDGIDFLKALRKEYPSLPFIIFTGKGREDVVIQAFESGADFYLQKGGEPKSQFAELARKITSVVEQRKSEARVLVLNRLYTMLSGINHAIIHRRDVDELMGDVCRIATGIGGFRMVWAGRLNTKTRLIEPFMSCGFVDGYFETNVISADDIATGQGPTGTAFREGRYTIINDLATDPRMDPWRDDALRRGYRAIASFPYAMGTRYAGTLTLYAPEPGFFDSEIVNLLNEVCEDISFSLKSLEGEEHHEVTDQKLRRNEEKFRNIFDAAANLIVSFSLSGIITDCNRRIVDVLGYGKDEVIGRPMSLVIPGGFLQQAGNFLTEVQVPGSSPPARMRMVKKDGTEIDVRINSSGIKDRNGIVFRKVWIVEDITLQLRMEDALRTSEQELQTTFNAITDPVFLLDAGGRIVRHNHALERFTGTPAGEIDGRYCYDLMHGTGYPVEGCPHGKAQASRQGESLELKIGDRWLVARVEPVFSGTGDISGFVHLLIDITDQKRREMALEEVNKKLKLLSSITQHDINNQLFTLKAFLELAKESLGDASKTSDYISKVENAVNAIENQIVFAEEYHDFGVEGPVWVDVDAGIRRSLAALPMRGVGVSAKVTGLEVYADPLFEVVLYNLIDNALRYGGQGMTLISVASHRSGQELIISVEDDGAGISAEDKKRLFERDFGHHTGLGLFLSREILAITGITIRETGESGKGARFEILLPEGGYRFTGTG
jgi:PAS domain S-box-containing protein